LRQEKPKTNKKQEKKSNYSMHFPLITYGGSIVRSLHALCLVEMTIEGMLGRMEDCHVDLCRDFSRDLSMRCA